MNDFKKQCIALRKKGYSINEIMKATGKAKGSIYIHIKDIPLSEKRMKQYREASGKWIRKFALARKGRSARSFRPFDTWSAETVLLVAHLLLTGRLQKENASITIVVERSSNESNGSCAQYMTLSQNDTKMKRQECGKQITIM